MSFRFIDTSPITPTAGFPFRGISLEHIRFGNEESLSTVCKQIIGLDYSPSNFHIMEGCINSTPAGPAFTISSGYIFHDGFLYQVDATTFTPPMGQTAVCVINNQYYSLADPTIFTDGSSHSVHVIRKIKIQSGSSGSGLVDFNNLRKVGFDYNYIEVGDPGAPVFQDSWGASPFSVFGFTKDYQKQIAHILAKIRKISWDGSPTTVCKLPLGFAPYYPDSTYFNNAVFNVSGGSVPKLETVLFEIQATRDFVVYVKGYPYTASDVTLAFELSYRTQVA